MALISGPHKYTEGDTSPPIVYELLEEHRISGEWLPMDLSNVTVTLVARERRTKRTFGGACVKGVDGNAHWVMYELKEGDLTRGEWRFQFLLDRPGEQQATVPAGGWFELTVKPAV